MDLYEFSFQQELLFDEGSSVLASIFHRIQKPKDTDNTHHLTALYSLLWKVRQDILTAKILTELNKIEGQFILAKHFLEST